MLEINGYIKRLTLDSLKASVIISRSVIESSVVSLVEYKGCYRLIITSSLSSAEEDLVDIYIEQDERQKVLDFMRHRGTKSRVLYERD